MHVRQIAQHRFVIFVHAAREVGIAQVLVARRLRHVLQHVQAAANGALTVRRKLLVFRRNVVLDVVLLVVAQAVPIFLAFLNLPFLRRGPFLIVFVIVQRPLLLLRVKVVEITARCLSGSVRRPVRIVGALTRIWRAIGTTGASFAAPRIRITRARLRAIRLRGAVRVAALLALRWFLLRPRLRFRRTVLPTTAARTLLGKARQSEHCAHAQRRQPLPELEPTLHRRILLILLRLRILPRWSALCAPTISHRLRRSRTRAAARVGFVIVVRCLRQIGKWREV